MSSRPDSGGNRPIAPVVARLERVAARSGAPRSDCADCVQDALVLLVEKHRDWSLEDPSTWAWVAGVVRRLAWNLRHQQRRRPPCLSLDKAPLLLADHNRPRDDCEGGEQAPPAPAAARQDVEDVLLKLNPVNRQILIMRAAEGRRYDEIAKVVGLTPEQARKRYLRTLRKARDIATNARTPACVCWGGGGG